MSEEQYPWTRRSNETSAAYNAFKIYMNMGGDRSLSKTDTELGGGNRLSQVRKWSGRHDWVARTAAFDTYLSTAQVDGMADQMSQVRNKHLDVASRLLDHLTNSMALWKPGYDPSIRWTSAFTAAAKVQQTALTLRETGNIGDQELIDKIMDALSKRAEG